MCEFCREENRVEIADERYEFGIGKECEVSKCKGYVLWCNFKKFNHGGVIHINYCPICGRELSDVSE